MQPLYGLAITPANRGDEAKLSGALTKLTEEDPSFRLEHNAALGELVIRGQGETHLRVMIERLENRFRLQVDAREPGVPYKDLFVKAPTSMPATRNRPEVTASSAT